ncbi:rhamnulokinase [Vibrio methylphosphonaticus]|uniref:rhamnulokinase n=1 Tax=Vibrio methylphosphonaticus TaxID=2946866 RepID=UPI00202A78A6|nr:rhamnulokinase [Vibrio methylphosphonaticus]MCL9773944.1 rhamnulokinase [Vibrio methylphosphonaticus]
MKKVVAVDIGASSGRVMLGTYSEHQLEMSELYRFENGPVLREHQACWDVDYLLMEIKHGIRRALEAGHAIGCIGIDTWGVDFVLIDKNGERLGEAVSYRDNRTEGCMSSLVDDLGHDFIYSRTGIQFLTFNTLYQLVALKQQNPIWLEDVEKLLFIPDYLSFQLTGVQNCEYTNASTSQLLNCQSGQWDAQLIEAIGVPQHWLIEPSMPNQLIGDYSFSNDASAQQSKTVASIPVASIASHDTASAILALPVLDYDTVYISSGTWSLMGFESHYPLNSALAQSLNFTNEGGAESRFRVLKNIMGLWLIQNVQKELMDYSFAELVTLAKQSKPFRSLIDPDHPSFLNPKSMTDAICTFCAQTDQPIPATPGEFARCIFESLAMQYKRIWLEIKQIRSDSVNQIHIIGGGIQNTFLNQLCADACGVTVKVGPIEASAIGNVCGQLIALGELENVKHARQVVSHSFPIETYEPLHTAEFLEQWKEFQRISNVNL